MIEITKGSIILTSTFSNFGYFICPSNYKHGALYFGKGLYSYLKSKNIQIDYIVSDNINYVIHNNGKFVIAESFQSFMKKRDLIAIYEYYDHLKPEYNKHVMSIAANKSCCFLNQPFSFFNRGSYCFELIVKSYVFATSNQLFLPTICILGKNYYNSKTITCNIYFIETKKFRFK